MNPSKACAIAAMMSDCASRQVGACLVRDGKVLWSDTNLVPLGSLACWTIGCDKDERGRCQRCVHAEARVLLNTGRLDHVGSILYTSAEPCLDCAKLIASSAVAGVGFLQPRSARDREAVSRILADAGKSFTHVL